MTAPGLPALALDGLITFPQPIYYRGKLQLGVKKLRKRNVYFETAAKLHHHCPAVVLVEVLFITVACPLPIYRCSLAVYLSSHKLCLAIEIE